MAEDVAGAFVDYERDITTARYSAYLLGISLLSAQTKKGLSPISGQKIFAAVTTSLSGIDAALAGSATAHRLVSTLAGQLGITASNFGEQKPPEPFFFSGRRASPETDG